MEQRRKWREEWKLTILGIAVVMSGYLAWGLFTISYRAVVFKWIGGLISVLTILCFGAITLICKSNKTKRDFRNQWFEVCVAAAFLYMVLFIRSSVFLWKKGEIFYFFLLLLWCIISVFSVYWLSIGRRFQIEDVKFFLYSHIGIILLLTATAFLCVENNVFQYKWDGLLYYLTCRELRLESLSSLAIYGHIAQTFGALMQAANLIIGNTSMAMLIVHLILMMLGIVYFYAIVRHCLPNRFQWEHVLITAVFAWSPYLLGMVHYYSLDFICQCLLLPVIYYFMKKQWILFSFFTLFFCFTKEPAIIVYGALCASAVVLDLTGDRGLDWKERIKNLFVRKQYYIMIVPGILWLATYEILGPWSAGEGGFGIDIQHVIDKLKNLYVLNFNWLFTIAAVIGIVVIVWKKDYELQKRLFTILCMQIAFTAFSCLFKTVNHPRYNDTNQVTLYLLAFIPAFTYMSRIRIYRSIGAVATGILAFFMVISSFFTIDPVSLLVYPTYSVGETTLIMTGDAPFGDGMIYNRQMLDMEAALNLALADSLADDALICFPAINQNPYYFDGMTDVGTLKESRMDVEYWNIEKAARMPEQGVDTVDFIVCQLADSVDWIELEAEGDRAIDLIYMAGDGEEYYQQMRERYALIEESRYTYRGWVIYRARFVL